jgi:hypothetical protein
MKKIKAQQSISDPTPSEQQRSAAKLQDIFKDHKLDAEKHKAFFDALIEWKRHL